MSFIYGIKSQPERPLFGTLWCLGCNLRN